LSYYFFYAFYVTWAGDKNASNKTSKKSMLWLLFDSRMENRPFQFESVHHLDSHLFSLRQLCFWWRKNKQHNPSKFHLQPKFKFQKRVLIFGHLYLSIFRKAFKPFHFCVYTQIVEFMQSFDKGSNIFWHWDFLDRKTERHLSLEGNKKIVFCELNKKGKIQMLWKYLFDMLGQKY
jgi:hypothetical protein